MKKHVFAGIRVSEEAKEKTAKYIEELREAFPNLRVGWEKRRSCI